MQDWRRPSLMFSDPFGLKECPPDCPDGKVSTAQEAVNAFDNTVAAAVNGAVEWAAKAGNFLKAAGKFVAKEAAIQAALMAVTGGEGNAIRITERGLAHVIERHTVGGALSKGKSVFSAGEDVVGLVRASEGTAAEVQRSGRTFQRVVDAGRVIGTDRATGQATSVYTVITGRSNNLITMFPGVP